MNIPDETFNSLVSYVNTISDMLSMLIRDREDELKMLKSGYKATRVIKTSLAFCPKNQDPGVSKSETSDHAPGGPGEDGDSTYSVFKKIADMTGQETDEVIPANEDDPRYHHITIKMVDGGTKVMIPDWIGRRLADNEDYIMEKVQKINDACEQYPDDARTIINNSVEDISIRLDIDYDDAFKLLVILGCREI